MAGNFGGRVPSNITAGTGPWFVQMWGIASNCTWQDLKDAVRPAASHVGHVQAYPNGRGAIACRKFDEAVRVFQHLSSGALGTLYVELWETSPNRAPRLIWKNMETLPTQAAAATKGGAAGHPYVSQLSPPIVPRPQDELSQYMDSLKLSGRAVPPEYINMLNASQAQVNSQGQRQPYAGNISYANAMAVTMPLPRQPQPQPIPVPGAQYVARPGYAGDRVRRYTTNSSNIPTNLDRGVIRTEHRGVFVSNLSFDVQNDDIHDLFSPYGKIIKLDHKREQKSNSKGKPVSRSRGNAIVTFATSEQASTAIAALNHCNWKGRELAVRFDIEPTAVDTRTPRGESSASMRKAKWSNDGTPLIVNGSRYASQE